MVFRRAFARSVVTWQRAHGRNDLPWQGTRDAYAIWISEIMLQQTQVATAIPYYLRFMARFPNVATLADAPLEDVLTHWSGLGYYSRARNLHRAAQAIRERHDGEFPRAHADIVALPGIGRSTASAIAVFAYGARCAILDGNVKRVLARTCGIAGYPGETRVAAALWRAAEALVPRVSIEAYTQGLMDLGATLCLRRDPRCTQCPVRRSCVARREGRTDEMPAARPRKSLPHRTTTMLVLQHGASLLLEKRPPTGVWGGLWSFPELAGASDMSAWCEARFGARIEHAEALPQVEHAFTHFTLTISPQRVRALEPGVAQAGQQWLEIEKAKQAAIPAPVKRIIEMVSGKR